MDKFKNYEVAFSGLKDGKHQFEFEIDQTFFELFETEEEFSNSKLKASVLLDKHSTFLEFWIEINGTVTLICDITGNPFDHSIHYELKILVKFGETYDDSNDEVITIPASDHSFNIAQLLYEGVMLSIPMKKISPDVSESDWELLNKYSVGSVETSSLNDEKQEDQEVDPRWEALKNLKNKK